MPDTQAPKWTPKRSDLKATDPKVQMIEERIRDAADAHKLDQRHVDLLVDVGIEMFMFLMNERIDDVERRVAALEALG